MIETDAAWLACAIDGEGYIRVTPTIVRIGVTNTNRNFVEKALRIAKSGYIQEINNRVSNGKARKTMFDARVSAHEPALWVLENVLPHLVIKTELARKGIDFIRSRRWGAKSPESCRKYSDRMKKAWASRTPDEKAAIARAGWQTNREARIASLRRAASTVEAKKRSGKILEQLWTDPLRREKLLFQLKERASAAPRLRGRFAIGRFSA